MERLAEETDGPFLEAVREFMDSGGSGFDPEKFPDEFEFDWGWDALTRLLSDSELAEPDEIQALGLMAMSCAALGSGYKLCSFICGRHRERTLEIIAELPAEHRPSMELLAKAVMTSGPCDWRLVDDPREDAPFADSVANWVWTHGAEQLTEVFEGRIPQAGFFEALYRFKPEVLDEALDVLQSHPKHSVPAEQWLMLVRESEAYDWRFLKAVQAGCTKSIRAHTADERVALELVKALAEFNTLRGGGQEPLMREILGGESLASSEFAVDLLSKHDPVAALPLVAKGIAFNAPYVTYSGYRKLLAVALEDVAGTGREFLLAVLRAKDGLQDLRREAMDTLLAEEAPGGNGPGVHGLILEVASGYKGKELADLWKEVASHPTRVFDNEFRGFVVGSSKVLREIGSGYCARVDPEEAMSLAKQLLGAKKVNERLGAICLLREIGEEGVAALQAMHATESNRKVHEAIEAALGELGAPILAAEVSGDVSLADLEASIAKDKHVRAPKRKWMDLDGLVLRDDEGTALSEKALYFLIQQQMKHKAIEPAPGIVPLLEHLPREQNAGVVGRLLEQWMASDQAAAERWVLTLAGLLGDGRVVPPIGAGIHRWCKAQRKELAVCGVSALALMGANEALMVLNDVAQRYTSKAANVGRAAAEAFQSEADARGVDLEALRDMVVPDLGFDADNVRVIASGEAATHAVLQPEGVLTWRNPETGKERKNPPAKLAAEVKAEIKGLRALLRDTVKSQSARLELAMVCQRRWSMADWEALFEDKPIMRAFSSRLVFGAYDAEKKLRSTFRRYPNGITADAAGEMIELEDGDEMIGLVHPLELDEDLLNAWREHLERFEIEPPFPQLTRPAHAFDPLHGNRKELTTVKGTEMGQGTLFSRSERLGWHRGSVVDGGELCSIYKRYPAAGVEVVLELSSFFMGGGWENWGRLETALFVKAGEVERGSYVIDVPQTDDSRVLAFAEVPPIVYSETVADLEIIAGESLQ